MLENTWAREYIMGIFASTGRSLEDLPGLASHLQGIEDPLLEIAFFRQGGSAIKGYNLALAALVLCTDETPLSVVAELVETVEECNWKLVNSEQELPKLRKAVKEDPKNGEKLARLGFRLYQLDERKEALTLFTQALEYPDTLCIDCHKDCLVNIGWEHYLAGEYEEALGWFEHACRLKEPKARTDEKHSADDSESEHDAPYKLALENVLLALAKMGRLTEATQRLQEYHDWFGRLPRYESQALQKLGLQADVVFIRSRTRNAFGQQVAAS